MRIDTDPVGADVESTQLGYLGTTPLNWKFTETDLKKISQNKTVSLGLILSKRGYVTVTIPTVRFEVGTNHTMKRTLEGQLTEVAITSDPDATSVFQLILDKDAATQAQRTAFANDPQAFRSNNPRLVTERFLGSTPTAYRYDPAAPLSQNEPLLFRKEKYKDQILYFKANQPRMHCVMQLL